MIVFLILDFINSYFFYFQVEYILGKVFFIICFDLNRLKKLKFVERLFLLIKKQFLFDVFFVSKGMVYIYCFYLYDILYFEVFCLVIVMQLFYIFKIYLYLWDY